MMQNIAVVLVILVVVIVVTVWAAMNPSSTPQSSSSTSQSGSVMSQGGGMQSTSSMPMNGGSAQQNGSMPSGSGGGCASKPNFVGMVNDCTGTPTDVPLCDKLRPGERLERLQRSYYLPPLSAKLGGMAVDLNDPNNPLFRKPRMPGDMQLRDDRVQQLRDPIRGDLPIFPTKFEQRSQWAPETETIECGPCDTC